MCIPDQFDNMFNLNHKPQLWPLFKYGFFIPLLAHWGRDQIATISQTTFWDDFREWKCINFD